MARTRALFLFSVQFFLDEELILLFSGLFLQKNSLYVGEAASLSNSHACKKFVQFLVILKSQLQVSRYYSAFLVVSRSCAIYIQKVLKQVHPDTGISKKSHGYHEFFRDDIRGALTPFT